MTDEKMDFNPAPLDPVEYLRQQAEKMRQAGAPFPDPERDYLIHQEWRKEWARCIEDYNGIPPPTVSHIVKQRAIDAKNRAIDAHTEMKARRAAAKDGNT